MKMAAHLKQKILKPLSLLNFNANGLKNQILEVANFLQKNSIDIACINETHLKNPDIVKIPNYTIYRNDRENRPGGGTAIIIKKSIPHRPIKINNLINVESTSITILINNQETTIASVYNQPTKPLLTSDLDKLINQSKYFYILGDLNAKHQSWNSLTQNPRGKVLHNHSTQNNYSVLAPDVPTFYPYNTRSSPDILDVILYHHTTSILSISAREDLNSDHIPTILTLNTNTSDISITKKIKSTDWEIYKNTLSIIPENPKILTTDDVDMAINIFTDTINNAYIEATHYITPKYIQHKNIELETLINNKRSLRRRWQRYRHREDKTELNKIQKDIKNLLIQLRKDTFDEKLLLSQSDPSKLWKISRSLTGKSSKPTNHAIRDTNGTTVYKDEEKTMVIAKHFEERFQPHQLKYSNTNFNRDIEYTLQTYFNKSPQSEPGILSPLIVRDIIKNLHPNKAPGPDAIQNELLHNLPIQAITHLTDILNSCLRLCYFPTKWKEGTIIALPKPGKSPLHSENLRPITLLNSMSKILEKSILQFITEKYYSIPNEQFGFRANHSTTHQLFRICKFINCAMSQGMYTVCVFLDIEKAFDTVWTKGILMKLITSDLPDTYIHILKSFLSNRTFKVRVNKHLSTEMNINAGVPQGAVLSPTLFNIYIADFPRYENCLFAQYADDTIIYATDWNIQKCYERLQRYLNSIEQWLLNWKIKINTSKSSTIIFTKRRPKEQFHLKLFNEVIPKKNETKYLGITLDHRLSFKPHVDQTAAKGHNIFYRLYPIFKSPSLSIWAKKTFYIMIIRSSILYAYPAWATLNPALMSRIRGVQRSVLRTICGADYTTSNKFLHEILNIESIENFSQKQQQQFLNSIVNHPNYLLHENQIFL